MVIIRRFKPTDAAAVSTVIRHTMRVSNIKDYPIKRLQPLIDYFSPEKVRTLNQERHCLVAELKNRIVGTVAIEGEELSTFFVHPDYQGKGIGTRLLKRIEETAEAEGISKIRVESSLTGTDFYERRGYRKTGSDKEGTAGKQVIMAKQLR